MEYIGPILAFIVWIVACWLTFVFVTVPLTLVSVALGLGFGTVLAAAGYLRVYYGAEDEEILTRPAGAPQDGPHARALRPGAPYPYWDDAWPSYWSGQIERDIGFAVFWPLSFVAAMWTEIGTWARPRAKWLVVALPTVPPPAGFLVGVTVAACAAWLALAVATEAATLIPRVARLTLVVSLRVNDAVLRSWYGAGATCPNCHWVAWLPAYRCSNKDCASVHHDLRPGRLGVLWHRCRCGARLPTTMLRAAQSLTPVCPDCDHPLHEQAGSAPETRIALSGGLAAGKTQLLMSAAATMTMDAAAPAVWEPTDDRTAAWLDRSSRLLGRDDQGPAPTEEPTLLTLRARTPGQQWYVHITDISGRYFTSDAGDPALWHLGMARRHVLVLDPTTFPAVRDRIGTAEPSWRDAATATVSAPLAWISRAQAELPYYLLAAHLNQAGARTRRCSLAIVVAKADLLAKHAAVPELISAGAHSHQIRAWLCDMDMHNLVQAAEQDFGEVQYFLAGHCHGATDPAAPFTWLLTRHPRGAELP